MKLNLGSGFNHLDGYYNVDISPICEPDLVFDLETTPWPWETDSVEEVVFNHSLEHMGETTASFLAIIAELHRICRDGAKIRIRAPHPRHDAFLCDPTHVRVIHPWTLELFNRHLNDRWKREKISNTALAHYLGVDFRILELSKVLDEPYASMGLEQEELEKLEKERNNVVIEYLITWEVRKDFDV